LNIIDRVVSQESRVLIITTNHITCLDKILIRPSRVNKKIKLGLADKKIITSFFCVIFKPVESNITPPKNAQSDILVGEDGNIHKTIRNQGEKIRKIKLLVEKFVAKVLELKFSPIEI
jgi:mitochondrial chaperone BCS1